MTRHILAVDPGKATGVALFSWVPGIEPLLIDTWETTFETFAAVIRYVINNYPDVEVVCESFIITVQTAKNSQAPFSLEEIGVLKQTMLDLGLRVESLVLQPTDIKKKWPNPALKKLGYWHVGGGGHALDAIRHALTYMNNRGWVASRLLD